VAVRADQRKVVNGIVKTPGDGASHRVCRKKPVFVQERQYLNSPSAGSNNSRLSLDYGYERFDHKDTRCNSEIERSEHEELDCLSCGDEKSNGVMGRA